MKPSRDSPRAAAQADRRGRRRPAGLGFAVTAAERGHAVTLYEAGAEIGGQFNIAKKVPGKEEFNETLRYFRRQIELRGVTLHLNTRDRRAAAATRIRRSGDRDRHRAAHAADRRCRARQGARLSRRAARRQGGRTQRCDRRRRRDRLRRRGISRASCGRRERRRGPLFAEWGVDPSYANAGGLRRAHPEPAARQIHLLQRKASKVGDEPARPPDGSTARR